jgi:hypothetical protein
MHHPSAGVPPPGIHPVPDWIGTCRAALKTTSARQLADAAEHLTGFEWQHARR